MDYNKIIQQKTEELKRKIQQIQELQKQIQQLNNEALKIDGAISQLMELENEEVITSKNS